MDLRNRDRVRGRACAGAFNFEARGQLATYLAWLIPWGKPVTLLAESPGAGRRAPSGSWSGWASTARPPRPPAGRPTGSRRARRWPPSAGRRSPTSRAAIRGEGVVVLDVRRGSERAGGYIEGSVHIPIHELPGRLDEVPDGEVWVHCAGGMRAAIAASLLDAAGRDVVAVDDSFDAAGRAGLLIRNPWTATPGREASSGPAPISVRHGRQEREPT